MRNIMIAGSADAAVFTAASWAWRQVGLAAFRKPGGDVVNFIHSEAQVRGLVYGTRVYFGYEAALSEARPLVDEYLALKRLVRGNDAPDPPGE